MTISRVQAKGTAADDTPSISLALDSNVTAGNLLVIHAMKYSPADTDVFQIGDISKSAGTATLGTFTLDVEHVYDAGSDGVMAAIYSVPVTGNGSCTIQVAGSTSGSYLLLAIEELSGADVSGTRLAGTNEATGNSTTPDSGTVNSGGAGIFCGCCATYAGTGHTFTEDGAFTLVYEQETIDHATGSAISRIVSSGTTDSASWSISILYNWVAVLAVYKEAAAGAQAIDPAHLTNTSVIHAPTVTPGPVEIVPAHLTNTSVIHAPTVATGTTIVPEHLVNVSTIHPPAVTAGPVEVTPAHLTNTPVIHAPEALTGACIGGVLAVNSNPRYVENDAGPLVLAGFHTWYNVQDGGGSDPPSAFDWDEFLEALIDYGCNFTKLWASLESAQNWGDPFGADFNPQYFRPERYERTGPGNAADGGLKFDLDQINNEYLTRLRRRAIEAGNAGLYVAVQLFQGWQIEDKGGSVQPFDYHPYNADNNINSVDGDFNSDGDGTETHTDTNNAAWSYQQEFIEALVDLLNDLDNVIWEVSNEDTGSSANTNWQEDVIDYIATYEGGKPKQHLIGRTVAWPNGSNTALNSSAAEWVSYNADVADDEVDGTKVSAYDTDHTVGLSSDYSWIFQALCNGHGGAWYMDEWDGALYGTDCRASAGYILIREVLGYAKTYAARMDLANATPQGTLSTTGYCLAKTAGDYQFLVYQDGTGAFDLTLTSYSGTFSLEWLRLSDGTVQAGSDVSGGAVRTLTPPWSGAVVAFLELTAQEITPAHLVNTSAIYAPVVTTGPVEVVPEHLVNVSTIHAPTVTVGPVEVIPAHLVNTSGIHPPIVTTVTTIAPEHLVNVSTIHPPTVTVGPVEVIPAHLVNTSVIHPPIVTTGTTIVPEHLVNVSTIHPPTVTVGPVEVVPAHLVNTSGIHPPIVTTGTTIVPEHLVNVSTIHPPTVTVGPVEVTPAHLVNTSVIHPPIVTTGPVEVVPEHLVNTSVIHPPTVTTGTTIVPEHLVNVSTIHPPTVTVGPVEVTPAHLVNTSVIYTPTITTGPVEVVPAHLVNVSIIHPPTVGVGIDQEIVPEHLVNVSTFYSASLVAIPATRIYRVQAEDRAYLIPAN